MQPFSYLPVIGVLLLAAIVLVWRPWLQRRRHGTWGIVLFKGNLAQKVRDGLLFVLPLLLFGQAVVAAVWPEALPLSEADRRTTSSIRPILGAVLMFGGILFQAAAMLELGASWRIGIEEGARPGLVTGGLYRFTRNPIFLALLVVLAGYTLLLPTLLSALILVGACIAIRQQIAEEESYLLRAYGEQYRNYARRVGRLLPGVGKFD
ncbi:MAG TPA: isoprenylcysteine carboxylmethyltransferase family protein [Burkholderiales bacterium]|nr:isoprenylcysteine carboxylmethyltransferase family protein [Burkholderiales bacterium]